jgi:hypothetical protein
MDLKKNIEQPLKEKILANEERIRSLFKFNLKDDPNEQDNEKEINTIKTEPDKIEHQEEFETMSQPEKVVYNNNNNNVLEIKSNNNSESLSISSKTNDNLQNHNNKIKKKIISKNSKNNFYKIDCKNNTFNQVKSSKKKSGKTNDKMNTINYNYNYNYNNYHNNNYNYNFNFATKNKRLRPKPTIKTQMAQMEMTNYNSNNGNYYNCITDTSKLEPLLYSVNAKPNVNLNQMFKRFEENQKRKNEKIERLKTEQKEKESLQCSHKPLLNQKTMSLNKQIKDDFLTRQKKHEEKVKEKGARLKQKLLDNERNKINESNYLLQRRNKENSSYGSVGLNSSLNSEFSNMARTRKEIDETINKFYEWDQRRKAKIEKRREDLKYDNESLDHIPRIDKRSSSLASQKRKDTETIFERLYREDDILREKKKLMEQLTTPSFKPNLYPNNKNNYDEIIEGKLDQNNDERDGKIQVHRNKNLRPWRNDDKIINKEMINIESDLITEMYRKAILSKLNRHRSVGKKENREYNI